MKVSIALASYNGEKFIREQIESIFRQTEQDFEIVVCDDCSTDSTVKILEELAEKNGRIKIFRNDKNLGFVKNFEKALSLCTGEFIALSDQDDIWTENHLEVLLKNIGEKDFIGANAFLCDTNAVSSGTDLLSCSGIEFLPQSDDEWFFYLLHSNVFQGAASMFKKTLVEKALPLPAGIKFHDYYLALAASVNGGVKYVNECILYYRQHGNNVTENGKWNFFKRLKGYRERSRSDSEMKINNLLALKERFSLSEKDSALLEKAVLFHKKKSLFSLGYFIKNYSRIYLSKKKSLFLVRVLKCVSEVV